MTVLHRGRNRGLRLTLSLVDLISSETFGGTLTYRLRKTSEPWSTIVFFCALPCLPLPLPRHGVKSPLCSSQSSYEPEVEERDLGRLNEVFLFLTVSKHMVRLRSATVVGVDNEVFPDTRRNFSESRWCEWMLWEKWWGGGFV